MLNFETLLDLRKELERTERKADAIREVLQSQERKTVPVSTVPTGASPVEWIGREP